MITKTQCLIEQDRGMMVDRRRNFGYHRSQQPAILLERGDAMRELAVLVKDRGLPGAAIINDRRQIVEGLNVLLNVQGAALQKLKEFMKRVGSQEGWPKKVLGQP